MKTDQNGFKNSQFSLKLDENILVYLGIRTPD